MSVALHGLLNVLQQLVALLFGVKFVADSVGFGFGIVHAAHFALAQPLVSCKLVLLHGTLLRDIRKLFLCILAAGGVFLQLAFGVLSVADERLLLLLSFLHGMLSLRGLHICLAALTISLRQLLVQFGIRLVALGVLLCYFSQLRLEFSAALLHCRQFLLLVLYFLLEFLYSLIEAAAAFLGVRYLLSQFPATVLIMHEVVFQHMDARTLLGYLGVHSLAAPAVALQFCLNALLLLGAFVDAGL